MLSQFMEPLGLDASKLATLLNVQAERLAAVISGETSMDAELDLRLGRYFRMNEGFFLRLQEQYEILEAKRALDGELDRIRPCAA